MDNKESTKKLSMEELMSDLTDRLKLTVDSNEKLCPVCHGLRFIYTKNNNGDGGYIRNCRNCNSGKVYVCKHCGVENKSDYCNCEKSTKERDNAHKAKESKIRQERYEKANKVKFKDYKGYFFNDSEDGMIDSDEFEDNLYYKIKDKEDYPTWVFGTTPEKCFSVDIRDIISNECADVGYDDMSSCIDMGSELLTQAQDLINKWEELEGDRLNVYYTDYNTAIELDELIKEIKKQIGKESKL